MPTPQGIAEDAVAASHRALHVASRDAVSDHRLEVQVTAVTRALALAAVENGAVARAHAGAGPLTAAKEDAYKQNVESADA